jgi:hypothetical protein
LDGEREGAEAGEDVGVPGCPVVHGGAVELDAGDCDVAVEGLRWGEVEREGGVVGGKLGMELMSKGVEMGMRGWGNSWEWGKG